MKSAILNQVQKEYPFCGHLCGGKEMPEASPPNSKYDDGPSLSVHKADIALKAQDQ